MKKVKMIAATVIGVTALSGCMGQMGATGVVTKVNLSAVDNRYAREGLFVLMSPIYGIASVADLFIFNAIEFWTGKNVITGKSPAVVDTRIDSVLKVNGSLDSSLTGVPITSTNTIKDTSIEQIDAKTLQMNVTYINGTKSSLRGVKSGDAVDFYSADQYITSVKINELEDYVETAHPVAG